MNNISNQTIIHLLPFIRGIYRLIIANSHLSYSLACLQCMDGRLQSLMSIYSGFPTRKDEEKYNSLLGKLITTLQQHLLILLGPQPEITDKQTRSYTRIIARMRDYEEHKYLPPKFSMLMQPLCKAIGIEEVVEKKLVPLAEEIEEKTQVKATSRSLHKPKFSAINGRLTDVSKKLQYPTHDDEQSHHTHASGTLPGRQIFQSSSSKISRPKVLKGIFPADHRVQLAEQYEQPIQAEQWHIFHKGKAGANGGRMRYRAFQALQQAQSNLSKRNIPLREQMRRKLKTEEGHASNGQL